MQNIVCLIIAVAAYFLWPKDFEIGTLLVRMLGFIALVVVLVPFAVYDAILKSLPEDVGITRASDYDVPVELRDPIAAYEALGFTRCGDPLRFQLPHEALLVPMMKVDEGMVATVYRINASSPKVGYDVVSFFDSPNCGLTTCMDAGAGVLPASPATLRQIIARATPEELVDLHRDAVRSLQQRRLPVLDVAPSALVQLLKLSFSLNRETFLKAKASNTLTALWRTITKTNPHMGPLMEQRGIEEQIQAIPRRGTRPLQRV